MKKTLILAAYILLAYQAMAVAGAPTTANITTSSASQVAAAADSRIQGVVSCGSTDNCTVTWDLSAKFGSFSGVCVRMAATDGDATDVDTNFFYSRTASGNDWAEIRPQDAVTKKSAGIDEGTDGITATWERCFEVPGSIIRFRTLTEFTGGTPTDVLAQDLYLER